MNNYITYIYLDPTKHGEFRYGPYFFDYEPFYVGEGVYSRRLDHLHEAKNNTTPRYANKHKFYRIRKLLARGLSPIIIIIGDKLEKCSAQQMEINLIRTIGRLDTGKGPLLNLTDGGDINPILFGNRNPMYGRRWTNKQKREHSQKIKRLNATLSPTDYDAKYKKPCPESAKQKLRIQMSGEGNPMYGRIHSEKTKRLIGESAKKRTGGEQNPQAKLWKVIDPIGNETLVKSLQSFCKPRGICADSLKLAGRENRKVGWGPATGWSAKLVVDKL